MIYQKFLTALGTGDAPDFDTADVRVIPVDVDYAVDGINDEFLSDISAGIIGSAQVVGSVTWVAGLLDGDGVTFDDVADGDTIVALVFYDHTGSSATSRLLCYMDDSGGTSINYDSTGANIEADWPAGILRV